MKSSTKDYIVKIVLFCAASSSAAFVILITLFLFFEGISAFADPINFIFGTTWDPTNKNPSFGALPLIAGSLFVTFLAILISLPIGLGCALFISELIPKNARRIVKPAVELLAGIPSVVYGFFGLVILTEWISVTFSKPSGESWLAGSIILAIMALPTIVSVSEDALNSVPREYKEGSLALGSTRWQAIWRVALPSSLPGITAAAVLGIGRAIGETMAVLMVTGNSAIIPKPLYNVFSPVRTITGTLAIEMGEVPQGSTHYHALFGLAILLFIIVFSINFTAHQITQFYKKRNFGDSKTKTKPIFEKTKKVFKYAFLCLISVFAIYAFGILTASILITLGIALYFISRKMSAKGCEKIAFSLISASGFFVILILGIVIFYLVSNGLGAITLDFVTEVPRRMGREGGIFPAIVGTLLLVAVAISIALPIGIGAGVYLSEYSKDNGVTKLLRIFTDNLNGTPSIVFGLFGLAFFVLYLGF
ncbi:MAG: phosphate ABC transporter permease subunit PstC, partial [Thermoplasmata archaeon]